MTVLNVKISNHATGKQIALVSMQCSTGVFDVRKALCLEISHDKASVILKIMPFKHIIETLKTLYTKFTSLICWKFRFGTLVHKKHLSNGITVVNAKTLTDSQQLKTPQHRQLITTNVQAFFFSCFVVVFFSYQQHIGHNRPCQINRQLCQKHEKQTR